MLTIHILVALAIIGLVLMQHGKGADMGQRSVWHPAACLVPRGLRTFSSPDDRHSGSCLS